MSVFHVDPKTGNTGQCRAEHGKCPFQVEGKKTHFSTAIEAITASNALMVKENNSFDALKKYPAAEPTIKDVMKLVASFENKSMYSGSMTKTYSGGMHEFLRSITRSKNNGFASKSTTYEYSSDFGNVRLIDEEENKVIFAVGPNKYAIDITAIPGGWIDYSDPYKV